MKVFQSLVFVALAALGVADEKVFEERIECESSDASPLMHHISWLADNLREEQGGKCFGSMLGTKTEHCGKTIKDYKGKGGGAVFSLCSGDMDDWWDGRAISDYCRGNRPGKISCGECDGSMNAEEVADKLEQIGQECEKNSRAGGKYHLKTGGEIRLYTAPARS